MALSAQCGENNCQTNDLLCNSLTFLEARGRSSWARPDHNDVILIPRISTSADESVWSLLVCDADASLNLISDDADSRRQQECGVRLA